MRAGGGELVCALLEIDGAPAAYALYRFDAKWERAGVPAGVDSFRIAREVFAEIDKG